MRQKLLLLLVSILFTSWSFAQCGSGTPVFTVDLTGNPGGVWISPSVVRNDSCCGSASNFRCIKFIITLDPNAVGINFNVASGALPPGALYYQIGCGPPHVVGEPICLSGVGPHILTFCKPGNNQNTYAISSIPPATAGTNTIINDGCIGHVSASGFDSSTVSWNSIYPGAKGTYNNYLSCDTCLYQTVTAVGTPPPYVDYEICGKATALCNNQIICDTVRVTFNPTLKVTILPTIPTICFGQSSITLTANGSGGTPPYSYLWNNINPAQTINVGAGTYTVKLSDVSGCPPTYASVTVTSYTATITANAGPDDTVCSQKPNALLNGSVTGVSGGIWNGNGTFTPNNTTLGATYTPTTAELLAGFADLMLITTGNGSCPPDTDAVRIYYMGFTGSVSLVPDNVSCYGGSDGSATVTITGGVSPYSYFWSTVPAQSTSTAGNLTIGTYSVTVENAIGCTLKTSTTITQPPPLSINSTATNISCFGGSNGSITSTVAGGTPIYSYLWKPGNQTSSSVSNLTAGTYTVTAVDSKGCQVTATYTLTQPTQLLVPLTTANVSCFGGSDGSINSTATGGTTPYVYSWNPTGATSPNVLGLPIGTYSLTVMDNLGCIVTSTTTITQPPALTASISGMDMSCSYLNNGMATAIVAGGTPTYSYSWQPGGQTNASISNLAAGTYAVTITDSKGCNISSFITINAPPALTVNFSNQTNVSCFGGSNGGITANVAGGTPGYNYLWTPGSATTPIVSNLSAGTYSVTATDTKGCQIKNSVVITQPSAALSVVVSSTAVSCASGTNGTVSASAAGGTGPYNYSWLPGNYTGQGVSNLTAGTYTVTASDANGCTIINTVTITQPTIITLTPSSVNSTCGNANGQASVAVGGGTSPYTYQWIPTGGITNTASGLLAGTYTVAVTDNKGCSTNTVIIVSNTTGPTASISAITNVSCFGGSNGTATAGVSGGTSPYTYSWSPAGGTKITATGLAAGIYTVTVTDANGCTSVATTGTAITQPPIIVVAINTSSVSCFGGGNGAISGNVTGGTPAYNYLWTPGSATSVSINNLTAGTYTLTATDSKGCQMKNSAIIIQPTVVLSVAASATPVSCAAGMDGTLSSSASGGTATYNYSWQPGGYVTPNVSNLVEGTYTITATDANGCTALNTAAITGPSSMTLTPGSVTSFCGSPNGEASVVVSGGNSPYTYQWSPVGGTSNLATGLLSGTYSVVVTDANNCSTNISINVSDNSTLAANISNITNVSCYGGSDGSVTVNPSGGTPPYTYLWSPGGGTDITATGLTAGSYVISVKDAMGCQVLVTTNPVVTQPPPIVISVTTSSVSCFGGNGSSVSASASGGTPGYTYTWLPSGNTGNSINGLSANTYTVQTTDLNTCVETSIFVINQPGPLTSSIVATSNVSCFGGNNGTATVAISGGTPFYNYSWTPSGGNGSIGGGLSSGTYTVTATDANACVITNTVTITQPTIIALTPASVNSTCGNSNGQASVSVGGGTSPYSYQWIPTGGIANTAFGLLAGTYTVVVTDNQGCSMDEGIVVSNTAGPTASIASITNVSCFGGTNGSATAGVAGGTSAFTYSWSPAGGTDITATGLSAGIYTVTVTDANGCTSEAITGTAITQPSLILIAVNSSSVACFGGSSGSASALASGGTPGYTYTWLPSGNTGNSINGLSANTYTVQTTDANTCVQTSTFVINQQGPLTSSISATTNVSCFGGSNGTATVAASGGTPFYNYSWTPPGGNGLVGVGLIAGTYTVNITDSKGCTQFSSVTIAQPAQALSASGTTTPVSCFGGSNGTTTITPAGGTPGYTYLWSPSGGTGQTATGLATGTYFVAVTDLNGCQTNAALTVSQPTVMSGTLIPTNPSCGFSNGFISSQISGGTGPYSYLWTPGSSAGSTISGVGPGNYSIRITDAKGCTTNLNTTLTNIPGPSTAISTFTNVSCYGGNNGAATLGISQGTSPYIINWSPYGGNSLTASSLTAGTYNVNVTDALGCTSSVTAIITQPSPVVITTSSVIPVSCFGGSNGAITVAANGGTPAYRYSWSPANSSTATVSNLTVGTYIINVLDQYNCPATAAINISGPSSALNSSISSSTNSTCYGSYGSATVVSSGGTIPYSYSWTTAPVQNGSSATNLLAGSYTITTTDSKGCTTNTNVSITQPDQVVTLAALNDTICLGQSTTLMASATGGSGSFNYAWQPSGVVNGGSLFITPTANTAYIVVAYDQNGCPGTNDTINVTVFSLSAGDVQAIAISPICPGQSSTVYVQTTGNTGPLTYVWNNGLGSGPGAYLVAPSQPTTYIVTVSSYCGNSVTDSVQVLFNPPPAIFLSSDIDSGCVPLSIQFLDSSITGNSSDPITEWQWVFGDGSFSNAANPVHVYSQPGTYNVVLTVITSGGCTSNNGSAPIVIYGIPSPTANFITNPSVNPLPSHNPIISLINQSTGAKTYQWDFGDGSTSTQPNPQHHYIVPGSYLITLITTNEYNCTDTFRLQVIGDAEVIFPTAFTPNPNGSNGGVYLPFNLDNDVFFPFAPADIEEFNMLIFDRWGELIFETSDIKIGWDGYLRGEICQQGVYIYKAYVKLLSGKIFRKTGDVTLIR